MSTDYKNESTPQKEEPPKLKKKSQGGGGMVNIKMIMKKKIILIIAGLAVCTGIFGYFYNPYYHKNVSRQPKCYVTKPFMGQGTQFWL